jgi:hypothetical protein
LTNKAFRKTGGKQSQNQHATPKQTGEPKTKDGSKSQGAADKTQGLKQKTRQKNARTPRPFLSCKEISSSHCRYAQHGCQLTAINSEFSTLNPRPSTLDPRPSTIDTRPSTLNPRPSTLDPQSPRRKLAVLEKTFSSMK